MNDTNMKNKRNPIIGITIGDPAGIGPEICVEALMEEEVYKKCRPVLIGCSGTIKKAMDIKKCNFKLNIISNPSEGKFEIGTIDLIETGEYDFQSIEYGEVQALAGQMAYDAIAKGTLLAKNKEIDILDTAPINKEAIKLIGIKEAGHTEIIKELTESKYALTMFNCHKLRVFFLSRHLSLRNACDYITKERVLENIKLINEEITAIGIENPKIAVAALNPHGSDNGLFGNEEKEALIPAILEAKELGINAIGPVPADSIFHLGKSGIYDAILSLYHDQGHIACKTFDFDKTISLTLGLPFLRASVDHGTAFDIAGKNLAQAISMVESVIVSCDYWNLMNK
ncbi:4-hydroxythreonine-4-phosphate dehydrogenase PdxA [Clostridium sp. MB05]|jgi:4-phospho-D-threonate 3-dehydrogenase / 4-phospho-D-erythronate 3-dehydrogenase